MQTFKRLMTVFFLPFLLLYALSHSSVKNTLRQDAAIWKQRLLINEDHFWILLLLLTEIPEFRSLFYYRIGKNSVIMYILGLLTGIIYKGQAALFIHKQGDIGPGLFIHHGFATVISAQKIGQNCSISQQVTIGWSGTECPVIGDNVKIYAGAKVIGGVHIGNNVIIGAGTIVVKDVPDNCTVVGGPTYIILKDGEKIHEKL